MKIIGVLAISILFFSACTASDADTPTAAFQRYVEAASKKDFAAMKENASRDSQKLVDEAIKNQIAVQTVSEIRNEQIISNAATLEYKNAVTGTFDKAHFVRENGRWKLALDKSMEEILKNKSPR